MHQPKGNRKNQKNQQPVFSVLGGAIMN